MTVVEKIRLLLDSGMDMHELASEIGASWRSVYRWAHEQTVPSSAAHLEGIERLVLKLQKESSMGDLDALSAGEKLLALFTAVRRQIALEGRQVLEEKNQELIAQMNAHRERFGHDMGLSFDQKHLLTYEQWIERLNRQRDVIESVTGERPEPPDRSEWSNPSRRSPKEVTGDLTEARAEVDTLLEHLPGIANQISAHVAWFNQGLVTGVGHTLDEARDDALSIQDLITDVDLDEPVGEPMLVLVCPLNAAPYGRTPYFLDLARLWGPDELRAQRLESFSSLAEGESWGLPDGTTELLTEFRQWAEQRDNWRTSDQCEGFDLTPYTHFVPVSQSSTVKAIYTVDAMKWVTDDEGHRTARWDVVRRLTLEIIGNEEAHLSDWSSTWFVVMQQITGLFGLSLPHVGSTPYHISELAPDLQSLVNDFSSEVCP